MIDSNLEQYYVVSKLRPDLPVLMESWAKRSASYRIDADASLDQPYGADPREKIDLFYSHKVDAPLFIYLHGGYWQRGDKSNYSFIAKPFVERGVDVALVGYPLCPQVSLTGLVGSIRRALVFLFNNAAALKINRNRFSICGNSAGGHLAAMMMATQWSDIDSRMPNDFIMSGFPLSGLYDLQPLLSTSLNDAVKMDAEEARVNSPQFLRPVSNMSILSAVGGTETPVFFTQLDSLVQSWQSGDFVVEQHVEENADHFDLIDHLGDSSSDLFMQILKRIR